MLRKAVNSADPAATATAAVELGNLVNRRGDPETAIRWWKLAVDSGYTIPGSLAAFNLGAALEARGARDEARACFARSVDMGAADTDTFAELGQENPATDAATRLAALDSA